MGEQTHQTTNGNAIEETWLCTHCGTPYTRKVRQEKELVTDHQAVVPTGNAGRSVGKLLESVPHQEVAFTSNAEQSVERLPEPAPHQEGVVSTSNGGRSVERPLGPVSNQVKRKNTLASPRRRSQLWQDSSFGEEIESFLPRRYPRSRKKSILLGLLVFILIAASVVSGALWQLQGINPLEVLVYWRM
jgi:hypothetical protein